MKVLVTGGSGFFGTHLIRGLHNEGYEVVNVDVEAVDERRIEHAVSFIKSDVTDAAAIDTACQNVDFVFHNAAVLPVSRSKRKTFWKINVDGTKNVLESSLKNNVKKVIFISSSAPYGMPAEEPITEKTPFNPIEDYGLSKIEAERQCLLYQQKGLDVVILRPRTIVGTGRLGIFQILYSWIADSKRIYIIGKGSNLFQLLSASDLADACLLTLKKPCRNEDFNIGADVFGTVREDLEALVSYANTGSSVISIPPAPAKAALTLLDRIGLSPLVRWHYLTPDKPFYFDISKAKKILGFQPKYSNSRMLTKSYDWYLENRKKVDFEFGITHRKSVKQRILGVLKRLS